MYTITSVGKGNNGWYHISHPVYGFIKQVRGYSNAIQQVGFLESHPQKTKRKSTFSTDDYIQSIIKK
jgi:hypothetical protein